MSQTTLHNPTQDVFAYVLARRVGMRDVQHRGLVHLAWSAPLQGERLVQWYVNGVWAGVSDSPSDREAWLVLDCDKHHQIELLAVNQEDAATSSPQFLAGIDPPTSPTASVVVLRDMTLPIDLQLEVAVEGQEAIETPLFSPTAPRGGFGAVFGEGGFGYDASTGPGLGLGQLGYGPLGTDGEALLWRDSTLLIGSNALGLTFYDSEGSPVTSALDFDFTVTRLPDPPTQLVIDTNLQLTWT